MAADARTGSVDLETRGRRGSGGRGQSRLLLSGRPGGEGLRCGDDGEVAHVGVRRAAELGTLAVVLPRHVGGQRDARHGPGDGVALASELRDPEAVDDVGAGDLEAHRAAGREMEVARRGHPEIRILELPPPLVPDDLDPERVLRGRGLGPEDRRDGRKGDERQDYRWDEGPRDLQDCIAPYLPGDRLGITLPEPEDRDQEEHLHHEEDRGVPAEDLEEDPVGGPAEVGARRERGGGGLQQAAAGQREADGHHTESYDPSEPRAPEGRSRFHVNAVGGGPINERRPSA